MKQSILAAMIMTLSLGGCCIVTCGDRLPNSYIKAGSSVKADCSYEDKLGTRYFKAPGEVLGMPKNAPGKLNCQAKGYKPYSRTLVAQDWNPLTPLSGDPEAMRYYVDIELVLEPESKK